MRRYVAILINRSTILIMRMTTRIKMMRPTWRINTTMPKVCDCSLTEAIKAEDPRQAIEDLQKICDTDTPPSEWYVAMLTYAKGIQGIEAAGQDFIPYGAFRTGFEEVSSAFAIHLYYHLPKLCVRTRHTYPREKSILSVLDYVCASTSIGADIVDAYIAATRQAPQSLLTDRFLTKIQLKLSKHWLQRQEWSRLDTVRFTARSQ